MLQVAVYRAADIREHQHRAADGLEQIEVWTQTGELRARIPGEQLRQVPPRYARQPEPAECSGKLACVARKFMPELHALEADLAGLGEAGLKLRLCAQLAHIVVGPDDGIRAQTNTHGSVITGAQLPGKRVALASRSDFCTIRDLGHRYVPPVSARGGAAGWVGVDDQDGRTIGLARRGERACELRDARHLARHGPEAARVRDEIQPVPRGV